MNKLNWKQDHGQLVDGLDVSPERSAEIQQKTRTLIDEGETMKNIVDKIREFCLTDEEFTAFIFGLGYMQGSQWPLSYKPLNP